MIVQMKGISCFLMKRKLCFSFENIFSTKDMIAEKKFFVCYSGLCTKTCVDSGFTNQKLRWSQLHVQKENSHFCNEHFEKSNVEEYLFGKMKTFC